MNARSAAERARFAGTTRSGASRDVTDPWQSRTLVPDPRRHQHGSGDVLAGAGGGRPDPRGERAPRHRRCAAPGVSPCHPPAPRVQWTPPATSPTTRPLPGATGPLTCREPRGDHRRWDSTTAAPAGALGAGRRADAGAGWRRCAGTAPGLEHAGAFVVSSPGAPACPRSVDPLGPSGIRLLRQVLAVADRPLGPMGPVRGARQGAP
jgi:hypothetical protein